MGTAVAAIGAAGPAWAASFKHPLGAQLYTVRTITPTKAEETLRAIGEIGYREVELGRAELPKFAPFLKQDRLKPVSCHVEAPLITGKDLSALGSAIDELKNYGVEYLVLPYIRPEDRGDLDFFRNLTDKMNRAGEQCHAAGLQFCYHNHAFEFEGEKRKRPIDLMIERLDPKNVGFEMDVFWVSVAGNDPVAMLSQLKGRVPLVHLKDEKRGTPTQYNEKVSKDTFQEVGHGSLDFPAILRAAEAAGVKHYFVEQDQTPGDPVASLKQSYDYLRSLKI
ncbi:MAG: sugar phosphate isomerase/epimerase [Acidobacteriota bacterium]|nr:sugar phosphate isomerase/epimerase [Acidobacteriota bacterium]